jgi:hypothetical protein
MPSMRAVLEARQKAAVVRVEELEAELERVRAALTDAEEVLRRRVIGLEQYLEALAEEDAPAVAADGVSQRKPVGPRRAVPHRQNAAGVEGSSVDYQALMAAALEAGSDGLGARRAAVVLGWDSASASRVEGARARMALVARVQSTIAGRSGNAPLDHSPATVRSLIGLGDLAGDPDSNAPAVQPSSMGLGRRGSCRRAGVGVFEIEGGLALARSVLLNADRPDGPVCRGDRLEKQLRAAHGRSSPRSSSPLRNGSPVHPPAPPAGICDIRPPNTNLTITSSSPNSGLESTRRGASNPGSLLLGGY